MHLPDTTTPIDQSTDLKSPPVSAEGALHLVPALDLTRAESLHGELQSLAAAGTAMVIDGSDVEIVSTPCLQLLAAAAADARRRGVPFMLQPRSDVLQQAVEDLGLVMYLREEMAG